MTSSHLIIITPPKKKSSSNPLQSIRSLPPKKKSSLPLPWKYSPPPESEREGEKGRGRGSMHITYAMLTSTCTSNMQPYWKFHKKFNLKVLFYPTAHASSHKIFIHDKLSNEHNIPLQYLLGRSLGRLLFFDFYISDLHVKKWQRKCDQWLNGVIYCTTAIHISYPEWLN